MSRFTAGCGSAAPGLRSGWSHIRRLKILPAEATGAFAARLREPRVVATGAQLATGPPHPDNHIRSGHGGWRAKGRGYRARRSLAPPARSSNENVQGRWLPMLHVAKQIFLLQF